MLTINPPEVQEDDIQTDESDDKNILLRMSPTRVKENRKARNCKGFNYIQLIVGMIIFVALSRIVGPPAFRMITRARSTALEANIQTAAETVRNVLAIEPSARGSMAGTTGAPTDTFLAALTTDAPFTWSNTWALADTDDSDTIKVQLINKNATQAVATSSNAPSVGWLLNAWDAVRVQARNQDGAWACALIILKPDTDELDTDTSTNSVDIVDITGSDGATNVNAVGVEITDARLRGIWYDSGDADAANIHHCSPTTNVVVSTATCEGGTGSTATACHNNGGAWISVVSSGSTLDPLPGGADLWGIAEGRVLSRNL